MRLGRAPSGLWLGEGFPGNHTVGMNSDDGAFRHPGAPAWAARETDFAVNELPREFPNESREHIVAAVKSSTSFLPATAGRVALLQLALERLMAPRGGEVRRPSGTGLQNITGCSSSAAK